VVGRHRAAGCGVVRSPVIELRSVQ
jgi:hypothetical protein